MSTTIQIWKPITNADAGSGVHPALVDREDHLQFYYDPRRQEFVYTYFEGTRLKYSEVITGTPWGWMESQEDLKANSWKRRTTLSDDQVWFLHFARSAGASETSGCRVAIGLSRKRVVGVDYIPGETINGEYYTGYLGVDWNPALEWMTVEPRADHYLANQK